MKINHQEWGVRTQNLFCMSGVIIYKESTEDQFRTFALPLNTFKGDRIYYEYSTDTATSSNYTTSTDWYNTSNSSG